MTWYYKMGIKKQRRRHDEATSMSSYGRLGRRLTSAYCLARLVSVMGGLDING